ncbi:MAG: chemotaxis protein CheV [Lachnospiraceae bacterium]|nr:chemotaxis protein CheV [Lachnospira sp.]MBR6696913.1 chemotaxis protein CheV [Lachnospiraceae bacterium]
MDNNILIESGTNELEILEFTVGNNHYGINVAKVREIVPYSNITPVPNTDKAIEGIFMPRESIITVISLATVLDAPKNEMVEQDMFIITNFNKLNVAFHVNQVLGIHRVSWKDIITPDKTINSQEHGIATGIVKINGKLIVILDFERIVSEISPETGLKVSEVAKYENRARIDSPIVIAEDSPLLMHLIADSIKKSGYVNITCCPNGQVAWDLLTRFKEENSVSEKVACIITDIEMPLMDGHRLTKLVKEDPVLQKIPVIIFSSLINEEMRRKGESLGANAQLSKPEIGLLVGEIDKLLYNK